MAHNNMKQSVNQEKSKVNHLINKCKHFCGAISVEPLVGLYHIVYYVTKPALQNLELEKACRVNLRYNDSICDSILSGHHRNYSTENNKMQIVISKMHSWQQPIESFIPLVLILFLGSYSDRYKWRKPFFVIPLIGTILGYLGSILSVVYMRVWRVEVEGILQKLVPSVFGGMPMMIIATTAYMADASSKEDRTFRLGLMSLTINVVSPIGHAISGILFKRTGYFGVLGLATGLTVIAFLYAILWIKDNSPVEERGKAGGISDIFNPRNAIDTFSIIFRKSPVLGTINILLLFVFLQRFGADGQESVMFLYTQKTFQWTPIDYSYFRTSISLVSLIGCVCGLWFFVKFLKMNDLIILLLTVVTKLSANVVYGCAATPIVLYSGIFVAVITRLNRVAKRSYATKIVPGSDVGKTLSIVGITEALAPVAGTPSYNLIYQHTLNTFPASVFFFTVLLDIVCSLILLFMYFRDDKTAKKSEKVKTEDPFDSTIIIETTHM